MATVFFGRSDEQFWDMTPRLLVTMINEWNKIERARAKLGAFMHASYMNGKDPDEYLEAKKPQKIARISREALERNARLVF